MPKFKVVFLSRPKTEKHTIIIEAPGIIEAYMKAVEKMQSQELKELDLAVMPCSDDELSFEDGG